MHYEIAVNVNHYKKYSQLKVKLNKEKNGIGNNDAPQKIESFIGSSY